MSIPFLIFFVVKWVSPALDLFLDSPISWEQWLGVRYNLLTLSTRLIKMLKFISAPEKRRSVKSRPSCWFRIFYQFHHEKKSTLNVCFRDHLQYLMFHRQGNFHLVSECRQTSARVTQPKQKLKENRQWKHEENVTVKWKRELASKAWSKQRELKALSTIQKTCDGFETFHYLHISRAPDNLRFHFFITFSNRPLSWNLRNNWKTMFSCL